MAHFIDVKKALVITLDSKQLKHRLANKEQNPLVLDSDLVFKVQHSGFLRSVVK